MYEMYKCKLLSGISRPEILMQFFSRIYNNKILPTLKTNIYQFSKYVDEV